MSTRAMGPGYGWSWLARAVNLGRQNPEAVIGGIALTGSRGGGVGAVLGAVTLALIENSIFFAGVPTNYRPLVSGLVIIAALALSALTMSDRRRRR